MNFDVLAVDGRQCRKPSSSFFNKKREQKGSVKDVFNSLVEKTRTRKIYCETVIAGYDFKDQVRYLLKKIRHVELILVQLQNDQNFSLNTGIPVYKVQAQRV
jgi:fatty acid-binding protein DegV